MTIDCSERAWSVAVFPSALDEAKQLGRACLGGQFQFRTGDGLVHEMSWLGADSSERWLGEPWPEYVERSCNEVEREFRRLASGTDFETEARKRRALLDDLVFVAYFVSETEFSNLRVEMHKY